MKDETLNLVEEMIVQNLTAAQKLEPDSKERRAITSEAFNLMDKLTVVEGQNMDFYDKECRRALDEKRNETTKEIEEKKMDVSWKRMALEIGKIVVPIVTLIISSEMYGKYQDKLLQFEQTGTLKSSASRQHNLPRFWK